MTEPRTTGHKSDEFNPAEIARLFFTHQFIFASLAAIAVLIALLQHVLFPSYRATATLYFQSGANNPLQEVANRLTGSQPQSIDDSIRLSPAGKYLQALGTFDFSLQAAKAVKATREYMEMDKAVFIKQSLLELWSYRLGRLFLPRVHVSEFSDEQIAQKLSRWFRASANESGTSISIDVATPRPELSLFLANTIAKEASQFLADREMRELDDAKAYVTQQLVETEKTIQELESQVVLYRKSNKLVTSSLSDHAAREGDIKKKLDQIDLELAQNKQYIESFTQAATAQEQANPEFSSVSEPKLGILEKIEELKKQNKILNVQKETLGQALKSMEGSVDPYYEEHIVDLKKRMDLQYLLFEELKKQIFDIDMQRIVVKDVVHSVEKARDFQIHRDVSLKRKILIALAIALALGFPIAFGIERIIPKVKTKLDLENRELIVLGNIPDIALPSLRKYPLYYLKPKKDPVIPIMCRLDIDSPIALAFKHIRARITHLSEANKNKYKVISLLSARVGDGKSFLARHLAACTANQGKKVLLIDCDLRKGTTSAFYNTKRLPGLAEVLADYVEFSAVVNTNVSPGLDLLPAGIVASTPTELVGSPRFAKLLDELRQVYDFIFIDTPPILPPPDAILIAKNADLMIVVATVNKTRTDHLDQSLAHLMDLNPGKKIFSILNKAREVQNYVYDYSVVKSPAGKKNAA